MKCYVIAVSLFLLIAARPAQTVDLSKLNELLRITNEYDTIFVGKIKLVTYNPNSIGHRDRYIVIINVTELLKGTPLPSEVAVYIHSPAQEFPLYTQSQLPGKRCVWALKRKNDRIVNSSPVFPGQLFDDGDLAQLRRTIRSK